MPSSARLLLASGSPRRRDLLAAAGVRFDVVAPNTPESSSCDLSIRELTTRNATAKALAIARLHPDAIVLGADTLVALQGEAIGKPADLREAHAILRRLCGREHQVCTGVYLCSIAQQKARSFHVISHVQFHPLTGIEIGRYLATINPLDKAGAYAAQQHGSKIIQRIRGSYSNVVGLPMEETLAALKEFGVA